MTSWLQQKRKFKKGDVLIRQGDKAKEAYLIQDGQVEIHIDDSKTKKNHHISDLSKGEIIGEMGLILDNPYSATITAKTDVTVYVISADLLEQKILYTDPLVKHVVEVLVNRIHRCNEQFLDLKT